MPRDLVRRAAGRLRRAVAGAPPQPAPLPVLGYVVAGGGGAHPASAHVRVVRRTEHLAASGTAEVWMVEADSEGAARARLEADLYAKTN